MALSPNTVWEVRTGGNDQNGGGFVTGASGTDYSMQNAAQYALTGATTAAANAIILHASAASDMIGNLLYIVSGTNFTVGWYQITAVSVGVSITVDRNCTTAAGALGVINIGGALATPGLAALNATVDGMRMWVKSGTYTITTSTLGSAGPVSLVSGARVHMEGYASTRGDRAGRPELNAGAVTTVNLYACAGGDRQNIIHMAANGNSQTGVSGFAPNGARSLIFDCLASNCDQASQAGFIGVSPSVMGCKATACTSGFLSTGAMTYTDCWADACSIGFSTTNIQTCVNCIATDCTGDGFNGSNGSGSTYVNCTAEGNTGDGFDLSAGTTGSYAFSCAATNNGGYGFNTPASATLQKCASYNNTSGRVNTACIDQNGITLTADPWVDAPNDDLRPNNTVGGGALLRGTASGVNGQTNARDVGAVQHRGETTSASF